MDAIRTATKLRWNLKDISGLAPGTWRVASYVNRVQRPFPGLRGWLKVTHKDGLMEVYLREYQGMFLVLGAKAPAQELTSKDEMEIQAAVQKEIIHRGGRP